MGTGNDVAMEIAHITLVKGDLIGIANAKSLSVLVMRNIKENLFFAFAYNVVVIPIAALGLLTPIFAGLAMALKDSPPSERDFMVLEGDPDLGLVMDRPLYRPEEQARITETPSSLGEPASQVDALYELDDISLAELAERLRRAIAEDGQASLGGLALRWPARHGSAELVGYLRLASMAPELAEADRRTRIEAYNERTSATVITDCPDPIFLTEVQP